MIVAVLTTVDSWRIRMNVGVNRPKRQRGGKKKLMQEDYKIPRGTNERSRKGNKLNARQLIVREDTDLLDGVSRGGFFPEIVSNKKD